MQAELLNQLKSCRVHTLTSMAHTYTQTQTHTHARRTGKKEREICSWARCRFSPTVKREKIKNTTPVFKIFCIKPRLCLLSLRWKLFIVASLRKCHYCMIATIAESRGNTRLRARSKRTSAPWITGECKTFKLMPFFHAAETTFTLRTATPSHIHT